MRRASASTGTARLAGLVVLVLAACGGPSPEDPGQSAQRATEKAAPGVVPPHAQRPGDAAAGYDEVINGGYVTCGIPYSAWKRAAGDAEADVRVPGRSARNRELPYYLTLHTNADGVDLVVTNCLLCHGATFNGELVVGLGNENLDFTTDPRESVLAVGNYVSGAAETAAWRKWGERVSAIAPYMITDTLGVNPAPNLTLALIAHRDPETLEWSDTPLFEPPPEDPLPVSVPPWWRMAKKNAMFYNAMGRGDHARYMMMKSLVCADSVEDARALDDRFVDVRAFISSLEAPEYPFAVDAGLAATGESVFNEHCSACHGTYGPGGNYPNLVVDLETIGTDPAYARQAYRDGERFMDWFNGSWYGELAAARPAPGYIAPPLDGVWATAPYLHNGSVPTIAALLESDTRPVYWTRRDGAPVFDPVGVGLVFEALQHGKSGAATIGESRRIYDTTLRGYGNEGHTFGDILAGGDRRAVLEYLKTL